MGKRQGTLDAIDMSAITSTTAPPPDSSSDRTSPHVDRRMRVLDLNADLGEGVRTADLDTEALDAALVEIVTSANVACGGHAGDAASMARVCRDAVTRGVAIGAQVSYVDPSGFGRTRLEIPHDILVGQLLVQIRDLAGHAREAGGALAHVKPHGALYNAAADDLHVATAVVEAVLRHADATGVALPLFALPGCALAQEGVRRGIPLVSEAFADRAYLADGRLVPRSRDGSVITDVDEVVARVMRLATEGVIRSIDGSDVAVTARSLCLHSDTDGALLLAGRVRAALNAAGVRLEAFVPATLPRTDASS